jgi:hypothetical protein
MQRRNARAGVVATIYVLGNLTRLGREILILLFACHPTRGRNRNDNFLFAHISLLGPRVGNDNPQVSI